MKTSFKRSNLIADRFRIEGNEQIRNKKHFNALILNNLSLCYAENEEKKSLAYGNRSAVYLDIKEYEMCLENINLAKQHNHPDIEALKLRESKCNKMMKNSKPKENPWDFFKLSHPANKKVPFIIDCLQIRKDMIYGRGVYTNRNLKAGEIIAIEEPALKFMKSSEKYKRCAFCLKTNKLSLVPSSGNVMFCSNDCLAVAENIFSDDLETLAEDKNDWMNDRMVRIVKEFVAHAGSLEEIRKMIDESKKQTVFTSNLNEPNDPETKKNLLKCILNLQEKSSFEPFDFTASFERVKHLASSEDNEKWLDAFIVQQTLINKINTIGFKRYELLGNSSELLMLEEASGLFPFSALINHSCNSNVQAITCDNKLVWITTRPIAKEIQIFTNYGTKLRDSKPTVKKFLLENYDFECDCKFCETEYYRYRSVYLERPSRKYSEGLKSFDRRFKEPPKGFADIQSAKDEIASNWTYIAKNIYHHPCHETVCLTNRNIFLLDSISNAMFTPA